MKRILAFSGLLAILMIAGRATAAPALSAEEQLQKVAEDFLVLQYEFDPVYATEMGEHRYDGRYPDFSAGAVNRMVNKLRQVRTNLKKIKTSELSTDAKIDYMLLESNIDTQVIYLTSTILYRDNPKLFSSKAIDGVYFIMLSQSLTLPDQLKLILERLSGLGDFLAAGEKQIKNPPQTWAVLAKDEADNATTFLNDVAAYYGAQLPEQQNEIDVKFAAAAAAFQDYSDFLSDYVEREGQSFAVGREVYDRLLTTQYFLDFNVDSLMRFGEGLLDQYQAAYDSLAAIVDSLPPVEELNAFIPRSFTRNDVLEYFQWEIDQARIWVDQNDFATIPPDIGECQPVETPQFLANIIGGVAYQPPGAFEPVQTGRFYVRPLPDSLDDANRSAFFRYCYRRGFRSSVVHEAYPGHHMQLQLANRNTSLIRRLQRNNLAVEGWALYCEEAMYNSGFYGKDQRQMLAIIGGMRFRAARVIVDTKLQTGQMTYQQAIDWMVERLGASIEYIEKEVSRYTLTPTVPMTYLLGKEQIKRIRSLLQERMGDEYSEKRFHDLFLNEGAVPPVLIYRKVSDLIL